MPSHMKALATLSRTFYTGCNDCRHAFSYEGVSNNPAELGESIKKKRCHTFSYEGVSNEAIDLVEAIHNVVMPSHMKALAT